VRIEHNNGYRCTCGHLSVVAVDEGTPITDAGTERGRIVAISGNTGFSAGAHLHFDVTPPNAADPHYRVNPYGWIGGAGNDPWAGRAISYNLWQHFPSISNSDVYTSGSPISAPPDPDPTVPGVVLIDENSDGFTEDPVGCWTGDTGGYDNSLRFTSTFTSTDVPNYTACAGTWNIPQLPGRAGEYDLYAYIPSPRTTADGAVYRIELLRNSIYRQ